MNVFLWRDGRCICASNRVDAQITVTVTKGFDRELMDLPQLIDEDLDIKFSKNTFLR